MVYHLVGYERTVLIAMKVTEKAQFLLIFFALEAFQRITDRKDNKNQINTEFRATCSHYQRVACALIMPQ